ncbi:MAG: YciI family protein [Hyphomonadaceae bacterium]
MRYMILIYSREDSWAEVSPERIGEIMAAYNAYTDKLRASGVLISGDELDVTAKAKSVRGEGGAHVADGPFVDTKESLGGYYLIDCASDAEALKWAKQAPTMMHGGGVELRPVMVR